ncbi:MAG: 3-hydroxyacyl-CoA dehydrogenase family protein [Candidatus Latescibacteria bacterium]|nr:3-hydroxyacyl-CoA dehydrogenase family protein [Candidatus Latescibacterota bacterium]MBT5832632.1 3-hydroxyacyl-CoA dehydrogenase family protein [Candidatus Latescibacterota bacterium]
MKNTQNITVIGAGLMGHGIAQEFAQAEHQVILNDLNDEVLQTALTRIRANFEMMTKEGMCKPDQGDLALAHIHTETDLAEAVSGADVVIEAMTENLDIKLPLYEKLDALCAPHTILASNSSSYIPSKMAAATQRPDKVIGTHYFNPPFLIPLVEVIRSAQTSDETTTLIFDLLKKIGKTPVIVEKEVPGFIANRIQAAVWREILYLVEEGVATPQDIDVVVKNSIGRRWPVAGPFEITELTSLKQKQSILKELFPSLASFSEVPNILNEKVERGDLGVTTGKGFYDWTPESTQALKDKIAKALIKIDRWSE